MLIRPANSSFEREFALQRLDPALCQRSQEAMPSEPPSAPVAWWLLKRSCPCVVEWSSKHRVCSCDDLRQRDGWRFPSVLCLDLSPKPRTTLFPSLDLGALGFYHTKEGSRRFSRLLCLVWPVDATVLHRFALLDYANPPANRKEETCEVSFWIRCVLRFCSWAFSAQGRRGTGPGA